MRIRPVCWLCHGEIGYRKLSPPRCWKTIYPPRIGPPGVFLHHSHYPVPIGAWGSGFAWAKWNAGLWMRWEWECIALARKKWEEDRNDLLGNGRGRRARKLALGLV